MKGSSSNPMLLVWITLIGAVIATVAAIVSMRKKAKKDEEARQALLSEKRKVLAEIEKETRQRQERLRVQEEARKEELEHKREMAFAAFTGLMGSSKWNEDLYKEADQAKRIDRLDYESSYMKVLAYDSRYHTGLVKGFSGSNYMVSGERCNCPDFLRQKRPCKHMYFLGQYVTDHGYDFQEADYEIGLKDSRAYLVGRFPGGKETAMANLKERGCIPMEVMNSDVNLAIIGNTTAEKKLLNLAEKEIRMLDYKDALQIFTSEIRHPEVCCIK